ncbi:gluzincin family metallopeptidase [Streptomyces sp. SGAir0957]
MRTVRFALPVLLAAVLLVLATSQATAAVAYSGTGWKIATKDGVHSLSPRPYVITFTDSASRTRLTPYAKATASQLTEATGTAFTVTTTLESAPAVGGCPAEHHLILGLKYRPSGTVGMSVAYSCYTNRPGQVDDHAAWGGWSWIDTEYWQANWFSTNATVNTAKIKNAITHEIGHMVGLDHPNVDLDGDGKVENGECVRTAKGYLPVMCSPNGGYTTSGGGGLFTSRDTPGLTQLVANYGQG